VAQRLARFGDWSLDPDTHTLEGSPEFWRIVGVEPSTPQLSALLAQIHPTTARRSTCAAALCGVGPLLPARGVHHGELATRTADPGAARERRPGGARRGVGAGHHRAAGRGAADPLPRLSRQPDRSGQPPVLRGASGPRPHRSAPAAAAHGGALPGSRPVQERQRLARSLGRRRDPPGDRVASARRGPGPAARLGPLGAGGGAAGRRRVHDSLAGARRRRRGDLGRSRDPAARLVADPARDPVARGHGEHRHRDLARRRGRRQGSLLRAATPRCTTRSPAVPRSYSCVPRA
jgi:hypothetical protein